MTPFEILEQAQLKKIKMPDAKYIVMSIDNLKTLEYESIKLSGNEDWNKTLFGLPIIVAEMRNDLIIVGE